MIFERIIVVLYMGILIGYLGYKFVKKTAPENIVFIILTSICLASYIIFAVYNIFIPIYAQISILLFGILIPSAVAILELNKFSISKKYAYYKMKHSYSIRDYKDTIKRIDKLIMENGRNNEYLYLLGMCYKALDKFLDARDSFALAIEFDDKDYKSYYEYGLILDSTNKKEAALLMFEKAIKLKPDYYEAKEALGICLTSQGRFVEAIISYREAVKMHKDAYEMFYNIGMLEQEVGNYDEAEEAFERVEEIRPDCVLASYNVGELACKRGDYKKAIEKYKKVTSSMTYGPRAYYRLAICYSLLKEYDKAMSILEYLMELDSSFIQNISQECAFLPMRESINQYLTDREIRIQKELDKRNYMKNKIIKFFKKDIYEDEDDDEDDEANYLKKFKIAK